MIASKREEVKRRRRSKGEGEIDMKERKRKFYSQKINQNHPGGC
jgi:hypothetical protein